jgi:serine/threonine-protein kinase MRCK
MNNSATNGVADEPPGSVSALKSGIERLRNLESVFLEGPVNAHEAKCFSTETLLDVLMVLFNECCNSSLRKEKTVTEFIELGKSKISKEKNKHL